MKIRIFRFFLFETMKGKAIVYLEEPVDLNKLLVKIEEAQRKKILLVDRRKGDTAKNVRGERGLAVCGFGT